MQSRNRNARAAGGGSRSELWDRAVPRVILGPTAGSVCRQARRSAGFSLIEVLLVIGLITFLMAAIVVVLPRVSNASKIAATKATIQKIDRLLDDRLNGFKRYITTQDRLAGAGTPSYVIQTGMGGQFPGNPALARVMAIKQTFMINFPQRFSELSTPPSFNAATHRPETESAACLYLILTKGAIFDTEPPEAADLKASEVADTDGDGLMEIVDQWKHPIRFYRWPTRLIRPAQPPTTPQSVTATNYTIQINPRYPPTGPVAGLTASLLISSVRTTGAFPTTFAAEATEPLARDGDDPLGLTHAIATTSTATAASFEQNFHTPETFSVPLIVSMGPDEQLGLFEPTDGPAAGFGYLAQPRTDLTLTDPAGVNALLDNITNQQK